MPIVNGNYYINGQRGRAIEARISDPPPPPTPTPPAPPKGLILADAQDKALANPSYLPRDGKTYCNIATADTVKAVGGPLDGLTDSDVRALLANKMATTLPNSPSWKEVPPDQAQSLANQGTVVIGVQPHPGRHGHVATVRSSLMPGTDQTAERDPMLNNIGETIGIAPASKTFSPDRPVHYYAPR